MADDDAVKPPLTATDVKAVPLTVAHALSVINGEGFIRAEGAWILESIPKLVKEAPACLMVIGVNAKAAGSSIGLPLCRSPGDALASQNGLDAAKDAGAFNNAVIKNLIKARNRSFIASNALRPVNIERDNLGVAISMTDGMNKGWTSPPLFRWYQVRLNGAE